MKRESPLTDGSKHRLIGQYNGANYLRASCLCQSPSATSSDDRRRNESRLANDQATRRGTEQDYDNDRISRSGRYAPSPFSADRLCSVGSRSTPNPLSPALPFFPPSRFGDI